jgi:hypothetical protein
MKRKKRNMRWVRRVDLIRVTMPSGGFEAPGSTPLLSPPRRRALHLIVFSTSSASPLPRRVLHLLVFSIPALCCPCRCRATFAGVPCRNRHRRGVALRMAHGGEGGCIPAALDAGVAFPSSSFVSWDTMPASYFLVVRCRVALLVALVIASGQVDRRGGRYAGVRC